MHHASVTAPVNIATLKYWGKRDKDLNLPTNSSISVTLSQDDLRTLTTAACGPELDADTLWINGEIHSLDTPRSKQVLADLRSLRAAEEAKDASIEKLSGYKLHIVSENNFPTAAGLASSAAGFAALISAVARLYKLPTSASELSKIARKGSGSACRSLFGGYVAWEMGDKADGSDSMAVEVAPLAHWPTMRAAILVVSDMKKDVPSTSGMQSTVATSDLFEHRVNHVVPKRFEEMKAAIVARDFATFGELTMKDSNSFHAVCLDSYPPIFYLNDTSKRIIRLVNMLNEAAGELIAAYTFDAGPNAVIYYEEKNEAAVLGMVKHFYGHLDGWQKHAGVSVAVPEAIGALDKEIYAQGVTRVILTSVGEGPMDSTEILVDVSKGGPKEGSKV